MDEKLRAIFPIFKHSLVSKIDVGDFIEDYAKRERMMSQPWKMLISRLALPNGTLNNLLLLFYLQLRLVIAKIYRFVGYTPNKCSNGFVQSAVDARRKDEDNPNSSAVAQTMELLAKSCYGYGLKTATETL